MKRKEIISELIEKIEEIEFFLNHIESRVGEAAFYEITETVKSVKKLSKKLNKKAL